ncbi:SpoIIE family protein phosphatase [Leptospira sp. 2 VSF19]|uniref:SpoIIE family protein phosphatase n=1 Tax=Leptospira soteropolitanensis TaxID=2950025 RepID=A0AAW5VNI6_9LEPT|nr:SpoIIE family protein phosphatase [Leptospira soteropolitanensis]MCW7494142.1 SpoIIE family protein phosphatase [Leptospira soteropolitanensis]MCW7501592.1 SpoIIE family protein phosphatase [Leptospira soteropolitanensis]MCW7523988.1 SpoIIE family protein phosphatase [Leptospira soteropolitanensis]MCW7527853.1 SpoIIE family protein phosphatase [Leptospira soteropolitanensis]MCW7531562.1 SpoIIE family protein phosphatase [Leptospira soteropolitanensis]
MKFHLRFYCFFFLLFPLSLLALPVDLTKNWNVKKGWWESEVPMGSGWIVLESLPLVSIKSQLEFPEGNLQQVTMVKPFLLSEIDFKETEADIFALHIPNLSNLYKVYINGELVDTGGILENGHIVRSGYKRNILIKLSRNSLKVGKNEIRILLAAEPGEELNFYKVFNDYTTSIDRYTVLEKVEDEYITFMLLFLYFFVGIYHALFYWKRRNEEYNLYFALFAVFLSVYMYFRSQAIYYWDVDPFTVTKVEYFVVFLTPPWLLLFVDTFFRKRISRITKGYFVFSIALAIVQFFVNRAISVVLLRVWQGSVLAFSVVLFYITIRAVMKNNKDAKRLLVGILFLMFTAIWDIIGASGMISIQNLNLSRFGFLFFVLGIAVVLANRFLRVHKQVEELNANLERKVVERTNELQEMLTRVQELKVQQDGDYFLTSLLLDPLHESKKSHSEMIGIQSYIKQKKEFEFKGKTKEIGGDLIICDDIVLNGKKYFVFINGDAMGKSIQGAGGALVLGVVFLSFIKRTQLLLESQSKSPERWIKECFYELQTIFESFDGSMLVSVVLGLVEEETGVLYYLNAEHPWTVLYRDGVASFIEDELELRKIGTKGMAGHVRVRVFVLEKGDILFIGSDGRDDLILETGPDGSRIMNEDETKFLQVVAESKGDLEQIVKNLQSIGSFSDDLTLLRLEWMGSGKRMNSYSLNSLGSDHFLYSELQAVLESGNAEEAYQNIERMLANESLEDDIRINLLREKSRISLLLRKFDSAVASLESIFPYFVTDNEILLQLSYAYRKSKNLSKAIEIGERLRARDPKHIRNLINLIECYRLQKNEERAKKILSRLGSIAPENPQYLKLKESFS